MTFNKTRHLIHTWCVRLLPVWPDCYVLHHNTAADGATAAGGDGGGDGDGDGDGATAAGGGGDGDGDW